MPEKYTESIIVRQDNVESDDPSFVDEQVDAEFEFKCTIQLVQILKSVQNSVHNKHDYVFRIKEITKIKGIEE